MAHKGLIQVYTGYSERLNFAPVGLALRAVGQGMRVFVSCLLAHKYMQGATGAMARLGPNLVVQHAAAGDATGPGVKPAPEALREAFGQAQSAALGGAFDLVIVNGIHAALELEVIRLRDLVSLIDRRPGHVELVFNGRGLPADLVDRADLVTEMVVSEPLDAPETAGEVEVVTGNGKGKTTYCLGRALLTASMGVRSVILQFMKSPQPYGEVKAIGKLPDLRIMTMGVGFLFNYTPETRHKHLEVARAAWEACLREIFSLRYGLVVLDEINTAIYFGLVNPERVREMLFLKPQGLHILLSGRNAHAEVVDAARTLIEMREIKHPFRKGVPARRGIEF